MVFPAQDASGLPGYQSPSISVSHGAGSTHGAEPGCGRASVHTWPGLDKGPSFPSCFSFHFSLFLSPHLEGVGPVLMSKAAPGEAEAPPSCSNLGRQLDDDCHPTHALPGLPMFTPEEEQEQKQGAHDIEDKEPPGDSPPSRVLLGEPESWPGRRCDIWGCPRRTLRLRLPPPGQAPLRPL